MNTLLATLGSLVGTVGILVCLIAGLTRLTGSYYLFGYSAQSLLMIGVAAIIMACYLKLEHLSRSNR